MLDVATSIQWPMEPRPSRRVYTMELTQEEADAIVSRLKDILVDKREANKDDPIIGSLLVRIENRFVESLRYVTRGR